MSVLLLVVYLFVFFSSFFFYFFFFFKQKTAYEMRISDWSSDVCSSDLTFEPSYAVTNARVGYTIPKSDVRVAVYVNNLFDKNYALNRSYVAFADYNTANFARLREWGVSLAVDF